MMITGNTFKLRALAAVLLAMLAKGACAQYVWIDDKGARHYSDRPPPSSVPAKHILKQPGRLQEPATTAEPAVAAAPTLAEREAAFRQRAQEQAERAAKAAEQARAQAARRQNCAAARAYLAQLESGERIGAVAANGERGFVGDAERARQTAATRRLLAGCGGA